jgi:GR25 family glycosyltransferase involved in LPS biosynthesis
MKINEFFQEGRFINLDSRPDRRELIETELHSVGLKDFFVRFSAFLPNLDNVTDGTAKGYRMHGACGRSHRTIVEDAKNRNLKNIIIMEDDAVFYNGGSKPAIEIIEGALDELNKIPDWDLFFLGGIIIDEELNPLIGNHLLRVEKCLTTHAWTINRRCYDHVLRYQPDIDSPIDGCLGNHTGLNKYLAYPLACLQRPHHLSDCDLTGDGERRKTGGIEPWIANYNRPFKKQ